MVKFVKQCQNCHLDVDIDPIKPPSLCPYCGKELLYSIEETKQIKLAENGGEETSITSNEKTPLLKTNNQMTVFTTTKSEKKYKRIAVGLVGVLLLFISYFVIDYFRSSNPQMSVSQNASYETTANNNMPIQKSTITPTKVAPTPTATPKPIYAPPSEPYIGRNYQDVKREFQNAGFKKFETIELHDMIIDIGGTHIGAVESISIRGNIAYDIKVPYNETDVVRIYYHSLK